MFGVYHNLFENYVQTQNKKTAPSDGILLSIEVIKGTPPPIKLKS